MIHANGKSIGRPARPHGDSDNKKRIRFAGSLFARKITMQAELAMKFLPAG
jgi:hypothetical protein